MTDEWTESRHIDIVLDGPPGPESGRFVEVEDMSGASVEVGEWVERPDGFWALRIEPPLILLHTTLPRSDGLIDHLTEVFGDEKLARLFLQELGERGFDVVPKLSQVH